MKSKNLNFKLLIFLSSLVLILLWSNLFNIVSATTARYAFNFDDTTPEGSWLVNDNTYGDMENLGILYNMGEGKVICRGVGFAYHTNGMGSGPFDVDIRFVGDNHWVGYSDENIPASSGSWRTFRCIGPTYLIDDDPEIHFIGTDPSDHCISIYYDTPSIGNSYYDVGSGWTQDNSGEYIVELIYEHVKALNFTSENSGSFTSDDNLDAYYVSLDSGREYKFKLERTSGTGNFSMRLVTDQDLTSEVLAESSGFSNPKYMYYTPSSSDTYVLLVEADNPFVDTGNYTIYVNMPPNTPSNPYPVDGAVNLTINPKLEVDVLDLNGHSMDVRFYNASDDSLIGTDNNVPSGERASVNWLGLNKEETYNWYVISDDGNKCTQSPIWSFTTAPNYEPNMAFNPNPNNNALDITPNNIVLKVNVSDPNGDKLDVSFFNGYSGLFMGIDENIESGGIAQLPIGNLSEGTQFKWNVIVDDKIEIIQSPNWSFTVAPINLPPSAPTSPYPITMDDQGISIDKSTTLSVNVSDPDGDIMNVSFYNAANNSLIGKDYNVLNGSKASIEWPNLLENTTYSWYVIVDDGKYTTQSSNWTFRTLIMNNPPSKPVNIYPLHEHSIGQQRTTTLSVNVSDSDNNSLTVRFYNAANDQIIGTFTGIKSGEIVNITWTNLTGGSDYYWYVTVDDGINVTQSDTWSFSIEAESGDTPVAIPGYNLYIIFGTICIVFITILKRRKISFKHQV